MGGMCESPYKIRPERIDMGSDLCRIRIRLTYRFRPVRGSDAGSQVGPLDSPFANQRARSIDMRAQP